jgi:hypothetical protein
VEIGGYDHVERLGLGHHARGCCIDQHFVGFDVGILERDFGGDFIPQNHAMALGVGLGDYGEFLPGAGCGQVESETHDAFDAGSGEDGGFGGDFFRESAMGATAVTGILAFAVLADYDPIEFTVVYVTQRRDEAWENTSGTYIGVLIEPLADFEAESPEREVVGNGGMADGAEVDGVESLEDLETVIGHHEAGFVEIVGTPREVFYVELEGALFYFESVENLEASGDYFFPDTVTRDGRNFVMSQQWNFNKERARNDKLLARRRSRDQLTFP